jgi:hypothetical protein
MTGSEGYILKLKENIMVVEIKEFLEHSKYFAEINRCPIDEIEVSLNGEKVFIHPREKEDFKFTGLSNRDYIGLFF